MSHAFGIRLADCSKFAINRKKDIALLLNYLTPLHIYSQVWMVDQVDHSFWSYDNFYLYGILPEIWKLKRPLPEFCPISKD